MQFEQLLKLRAQISTWFLAIFFLVIMGGALISELFQAPTVPYDMAQIYVNPVPEEIFTNIKNLSLKNKFGEFKMQKNLDENSPKHDTWRLLSPRELPAKAQTLKQIIDALQEVTVRKIHQYEPINISSFSLDNPLIHMEFEVIDGAKYEIKIGLINPIDNSAYMTVTDHQTIYQIENLKFPIETFELGDFIEPRIFVFNPAEVDELSFYREQITNRPYFKITKTENNWFDSRQTALDATKTAEYFKNLFNLRSQVILDKPDESIIELLDQSLKRPQYIVVLKRQGKEIEYRISYPIKQMPQFKVENRQSVIIKSSDEEQPYIVSKDLLKVFETSERSLNND
ncbi:MAG: DUF4340 domain-containing protein [Bacteriovoracaceae bacterium]|nr:DUF4340 domain-containing protein [Bacteriovoracaceae bacterium]